MDSIRKNFRQLKVQTSVAPPVYRPQPVPRVLQKKTATARPLQAKTVVLQQRRSVPQAPKAYRPQPMPLVLQKKEARGVELLRRAPNRISGMLVRTVVQRAEGSSSSSGPPPYQNPLGLSNQQAYDPNARRFHRRSSFDYTPPVLDEEDVPQPYRVNGGALHRRLCQGLSGGLTENFVALGMSLVYRTNDQLFTNQSSAPSTWSSGGEKPPEFYQMLQTVGHRGSTIPAKVWHSEQAMVFQIGQENGKTLHTLLAATLRGVPRDCEILLMILEVHSHVRGICNNCARTLKSLVTSQWIEEAIGLLTLWGTFEIDLRNMKVVLRTSADEYFSGGGATAGQQTAQSQPPNQIHSYQHTTISKEHHQLPWDLGNKGTQ